MHTSERTQRAAALQKVAHFLTALVVILKGIVKLEHPEGYWPLIVFLFAGGAYIAIVTILHDRLHHHMRRIEASVYAIESLVMVAMTWIFVSEGKNAIQYVTALAALAFAIATAVRLVPPRNADAHEDAPLAHEPAEPAPAATAPDDEITEVEPQLPDDESPVPDSTPAPSRRLVDSSTRRL